MFPSRLLDPTSLFGVERFGRYLIALAERLFTFPTLIPFYFLFLLVRRRYPLYQYHFHLFIG
jgi:hypothetical protein